LGLNHHVDKATENAGRSRRGGLNPRSFQVIQDVAKLLRFPEIDLAPGKEIRFDVNGR
jgi:hypothetical protein